MADIVEIELINKYKSNIREYGYNLSSGGNHHKEITDNQRQAIIKSNQTRSISDETKEKMRKRFQGENGHWYGITKENHPRYGIKMSEDAKKAIGEKNRKENWSEETVKNKEESYKKQAERMKGCILRRPTAAAAVDHRTSCRWRPPYAERKVIIQISFRKSCAIS